MKYYTQVVVRWYVEPDFTKIAICLATIALKMNFGIVTPWDHQVFNSATFIEQYLHCSGFDLWSSGCLSLFTVKNITNWSVTILLSFTASNMTVCFFSIESIFPPVSVAESCSTTTTKVWSRWETTEWSNPIFWAGSYLERSCKQQAPSLLYGHW